MKTDTRTEEAVCVKTDTKIENVFTSLGMPKTASNCQKLGRHKEGIFSRAFRWNRALPAPCIFSTGRIFKNLSDKS